MKKSVLSLAGAVSVGVVALGLIGSSTAVADPTPAGDRTYTAVGSDTIQDVWNGLSNGSSPAAGDVASYNAFGSAYISFNGVTIDRPAGSGAGVKVVSASADPAFGNYTYKDASGKNASVDLHGKVQFARSSSGPKTTGTDLLYIPFARDAVSVAVKTTTAGAVTATTAQLKDLYSCNTSTIKVGTADVTVKPVLPQASSGTRAFFLKAIGVTESALGGCVVTRGEENKGSLFSDAGDLAPFSAGQWIYQKNTGGTTDTTAGLKLGTLNGQAPTKTVNSKLVANADGLFGAANAVPDSSHVFARDTYSVISNVNLNSTLATKLRDIRSAQAIADFGFLNLGYSAGSNEPTAKFEH